MKHSPKYMILCFVAAILSLPACVLVDTDNGFDTGHGQQVIVGSGRVVVISFGFRDFSRISLSQSFKATVRKGNAYSIRVEVDDNIQQYVLAHQSGSAISIGLEDNSYKNITMNITIETPDVEFIEALGAGSIRLDGFDLNHDLQIIGSGASVINGNLFARGVTFNLTGSSTVDLTGRANDLTVFGTGATQLSLFEFPARNCKVIMTGGSVSNIQVSDNLEVSLTGGSLLRYKGNPATKIVSVTGGSVIQKVG
jgi:hypothetical protein